MIIAMGSMINRMVNYIIVCINNIRVFLYKNCVYSNEFDENDSQMDESLNSFQETIIELKTRSAEETPDSYVSFDDYEHIVNLPEVQHYYDYNIPTQQL